MSLPARLWNPGSAIVQEFARSTSALLSRCPPERSFFPSAPAETVEPPLGEAIPEGLPELSEIPDVPADVPVEPLPGRTSETATGVGSNFLTGFFSGAMNTFFAPERQAAEQRGGSVASLVTHGVFLTTAWFVSRSSPCRGVAEVIGSAFQRVPLLGQGPLGSVVQMVVGAQLGEYAGRKLGELRGKTTSPAVGAEEGAPFEIYLSEMCVLCHDAFGNGANRVAALSCGHACLCSDNGCVAQWEASAPQGQRALLDRARREMQRQEDVAQSHTAKFHCIEASLDAASRELTTEARSSMKLAEGKAEALASEVAAKVGRSAAEEQLDEALVTFREELSQIRGGTVEASQASSLLRAELSEAKTCFSEADAQLCDQIDGLRGSLTEANGALRVQVEEAKAAGNSSSEATGCLRHEVEAVSSEVRVTQQEVQSLKRGSQETTAAVREGFVKVQTLSAEAIAGLRQQLAETKTDLAEAEKSLQVEHAKVLKFAGHAEFEAQTAAQQTSRLAAGLRGVEETLERRMQWVAASSNELEASVAHAFAESHSALARTSRALAAEVVAERCRSAQVEEDVVSRLRRFEDAVSGDSRSQADAVEQLNQAIAVAALRRQGEERNLLKKVHDSLRSIDERRPLERRELVEAAGRAVAEQSFRAFLGGCGTGSREPSTASGPSLPSPTVAMARRIDGLYCTAESADEVVRRVIAETHNEAEKVRNEVAAAVSERIQALQARQQELLNQIDFMVQSKVQTLENQLQEIQGQVCPFAPNQEDPDGAPMEGVFLLRADAVVRFRLGDTDFGEKIPEWGQVGEKSTYASMSFAKGPGLGVLKVNNPSFLWVFACDRDGARRTEGGDRVVATLSHPEDFQDVAVEDLQDGRCTSEVDETAGD
ncbi:unnamed protein product [Symbiodinium sp. CCMP2456]|nr:unnamed protein product [Symbiodinium sp. CCMP2456]